MVIEICLAVITLSLIALAIILTRISFQIQRSIYLLQTDIQRLSVEASHLITDLKVFVNADLPTITEETKLLIHKLNDLSSNINAKSHSLNFLFKPLEFLNSKLTAGSSSDEPEPQKQALPQILRWIASSASLFKTTKEFVKNYEKRT
jgi:uncharacterized protein YoxC